MDLLEYQGKELFARHGIPLLEGRVATSAAQARAAAEAFGGSAAVKVQVPTGKRGKGGGIVLARSADEAEAAAARMFSEGFQGMPVTTVLVERLAELAGEFYAAITLDRANRAYVAMTSTEGGMDVEEIAASRPEALRRAPVDPLLGMLVHTVRYLSGGFPPDARAGVSEVLTRMWELLVANDATLVEINPLVLLADGSMVALDAKVTADDNALYRRPELAGYQAFSDPTEARAREAGLQYVKLDGEIGIIGNGAGLVMSTLDVVQQAGGAAANFLDVGGGASADMMALSLEVVLSDPAVRSVLVNIFGGITRCDDVARGIVEALGRVEALVPIVVRLDGTNAGEGRTILGEASHERIVPAETMLEGAERAVALAREGAGI
ncbi:MAG TPA: ADP-forming succinate--CoA ligase subunit beta [Actinomycetota bacterium]|nr:ADP-forming succinate--CoA ligase subunit beta [Actinomycetota bacterium]